MIRAPNKPSGPPMTVSKMRGRVRRLLSSGRNNACRHCADRRVEEIRLKVTCPTSKARMQRATTQTPGATWKLETVTCVRTQATRLRALR
jgi:hypothetical protein